MTIGARIVFPAYAVEARTTVAPVAPDLDLRSGGTFARALAAYYYTQAPTDGSSAFLASASSGTRRAAEDRGDALGVALLMEKAATNYLLRSREQDNAAWLAPAATVTADVGNGPDGTAVADRVVGTNQRSGYQDHPGPGGRVVMSVWNRSTSGASANQISIFHSDAASVVAAGYAATTTTWSRLWVTTNATTNSGGTVSDSRDQSAAGGHASFSQDVRVDMAQLEAGYYPTSPIDTAGAAVTRPADVLSYTTGNYPAGFLTNGVVIVFASDASSTEIASASEEWRLVQNGGNGVSIIGYTDGVTIRAAAGSCVIDLVVAGTVVATKTVTFSRGQALTITAKPSAGSLTVAGATTGNGTNTGSGAAWTSGQTLYIGGNASGARNVTGRYLDARGLGLIPCIQVAP